MKGYGKKNERNRERRMQGGGEKTEKGERRTKRMGKEKKNVRSKTEE
jgi:hypothetical protein